MERGKRCQRARFRCARASASASGRWRRRTRRTSRERSQGRDLPADFRRLLAVVVLVLREQRAVVHACWMRSRFSEKSSPLPVASRGRAFSTRTTWDGARARGCVPSGQSLTVVRGSRRWGPDREEGADDGATTMETIFSCFVLEKRAGALLMERRGRGESGVLVVYMCVCICVCVHACVWRQRRGEDGQKADTTPTWRARKPTDADAFARRPQRSTQTRSLSISPPSTSTWNTMTPDPLSCR